MTALEQTITAVATRYLGGDLNLLGLDSLATIELAAALEDELGRELPDDLLSGCHDVRALALRLSALNAPGTQLDDPFEQMLSDAVLPSDLDRPARRESAANGIRDARTILLTGATGFLGSALLQELLETSNARIICLVRPTSLPLAATARDRVQVVVGDLTVQGLGIDAAAYAAIIRDTDAVLHAAAAVNWVHSYAALRSTNVTGTLDLLRLAFAAGASFHFVSSLSTCYSTSGPQSVDESYDALAELRGLHLGYAQTKAVGESLVREAGRRGLPVHIYRPALISGHSRTGAFNQDDVVTGLIRGCVHMRTAPDLDWKLDSVPVDCVARSIVDLSDSRALTAHLGHQRPRHWRECVLWMRMYGYDVELVSYHAWLRQLERETNSSAEGAAEHPLRALRSFFLNRPANAGGLTLPELYEERRRTCASSARTQTELEAKGTPSVPLDAALLDTYFGAFRAAQQLPAPNRMQPFRAATRVSRSPQSLSPLDPAVLSRALGRRVRDVTLISSGSDHSIVSELTAWSSGRPAGLFRARVQMDDGPSDVFIKVKAPDSDVMAVGRALAGLVDPALGRAYGRHAERAGFAASHVREIAVYRQTDPRITTHIPGVLGTLAESSTQTWITVLEDVSDAALINCADDPEAWRSSDIEAVIDGLAALHAPWLGREKELQQKPWIGHVPNASSMGEMTELWCALADHAAPAFSGWADPTMVRIHQGLAEHAGDWWRVLEQGPRTLIHHDFNPRNICLRRVGGGARRLCAYDWELATVGAPQRDLAEFLCFVLTQRTVADAPAWIERHRLALQKESGAMIDGHTWASGFASALYDLLINRLATYAVVHRVRRQSFLPRVVATWRQLYRLYPYEEHA